MMKIHFNCNKHFVTAKAKSLNKCVKHTHCQCTYRALRRVDSRVHSQSSSSVSDRPLREPNMELLLVSFSIAILKGTKLPFSYLYLTQSTYVMDTPI